MNKNFFVFGLVAFLLFGGGLWYRYKSNAADERGATKLMRSFEEETNQQKVLRLIRHADNVNERDKSGRTALFYAVQHGANAEMIRHLLRMGADTSITDTTGQTVLMVAARYSQAEDVLVQLLVAGTPLNITDRDGYTALMYAAQYNTPGIVKKLVRGGADPDITAPDGKNAAKLLAENKKFSKEEKDDFTQAFKILSIIGPRPPVFMNSERK